MPYRRSRRRIAPQARCMAKRKRDRLSAGPVFISVRAGRWPALPPARADQPLAGAFLRNMDLMLSHSSIFTPFFFMMAACCATDRVLFQAQ